MVNSIRYVPVFTFIPSYRLRRYSSCKVNKTFSNSIPNTPPPATSPRPSRALVKGFKEGNQFETLLGVTGSGKTFTMANVIQQLTEADADHCPQ